MTEKNKLIRS